jgi:hypothetical protein
MGRRALPLFFASHGSTFKVPSDWYTMAAHRVLGLTAERASHARQCHGAMRLPHSLLGLDLCRRYRAPLSSCRVSAPKLLCLWTTSTPRCPCSWYAVQLHDRIVYLLEEFMLEAGATEGRDFRLEVRYIRSRASRYRHGDVVWLDFRAPHRHLAVDVTVTSARTKTNVPHIGARLLLPANLAL